MSSEKSMLRDPFGTQDKIERVRVTIAMPRPLYDRLRNEYAGSYNDHRMSWSAWLLMRLEAP